jgi:hypothetical protein
METIKQIKEELDKQGIEYPKNALKADLEDLLILGITLDLEALLILGLLYK